MTRRRTVPLVGSSRSTRAGGRAAGVEPPTAAVRRGGHRGALPRRPTLGDVFGLLFGLVEPVLGSLLLIWAGLLVGAATAIGTAP